MFADQYSLCLQIPDALLGIAKMVAQNFHVVLPQKWRLNLQWLGEG